jgi:hypothetical protein
LNWNWFYSSAFLGPGGFLSGFFGESLYNYRYDLQTGTSYYRKSDGTVDSWKSPSSRGKFET